MPRRLRQRTIAAADLQGCSDAEAAATMSRRTIASLYRAFILSRPELAHDTSCQIVRLYMKLCAS